MGRKKEEKKIINIERGPYMSISFYDFEGTIDYMIEFLTKRKEEDRKTLELLYPDNFEDIIITYEEISTWDGDRFLEASFSRIETDEEFENRLKKNREIVKSKKEAERLAALKKEQEELELYEKLKKKYES